MARIARIAAGSALLALALSGCGGDGESRPTASSPAETVPASASRVVPSISSSAPPSAPAPTPTGPSQQLTSAQADQARAFVRTYLNAYNAAAVEPSASTLGGLLDPRCQPCTVVTARVHDLAEREWHHAGRPLVIKELAPVVSDNTVTIRARVDQRSGAIVTDAGLIQEKVPARAGVETTYTVSRTSLGLRITDIKPSSVALTP